MKNIKELLISKIIAREITVGVVGLGYVGLPLAVEKAKAGFKTIGFDVQKEKVDMVIALIKDICKSRKQVFTTPIPPTGSAGVFIPYPIDVMVGGATIFVVDIDRFEKV